MDQSTVAKQIQLLWNNPLKFIDPSGHQYGIGDIIPAELWHGQSFGTPYVEITADGPVGHGTYAKDVPQLRGNDPKFQPDSLIISRQADTREEFAVVIEENSEHRIKVRDYETEQAFSLDAFATKTTQAYKICLPRPDMPDDKLRWAGLLEIPAYPGFVVRKGEPMPGVPGLMESEAGQDVLLGLFVSLTPFPGDDAVYWSWKIFKFRKSTLPRKTVTFGVKKLNDQNPATDAGW